MQQTGLKKISSSPTVDPRSDEFPNATYLFRVKQRTIDVERLDGVVVVENGHECNQPSNIKISLPDINLGKGVVNLARGKREDKHRGSFNAVTMMMTMTMTMTMTMIIMIMMMIMMTMTMMRI